MPDAFLNRTEELAALERLWAAPRGSLGIVWGRRRVGKTRLLGAFSDHKRVIFYGATEQAGAAELAAFAEAARTTLAPHGADLLALGGFPTWEGAFTYLAAQAHSEPLLVVLDEFPYLVAAEPALPSILQRFWDHAGRRSHLKLILCGSARSAMEGLQAERAPLFGRADLTLQVGPFAPSHVGLFLRNSNAIERAIAFGVLGGMPTYLSRWDAGAGHETNLRRLFGDPSSPMIDEGELVVSSEVPEGAGYFRILHAIASGHRTSGAIRSFADIDIARQLDRLLRLGLVIREVPATEDPDRSRRSLYTIGDNFLSFWFRFVYRRRADIARGLGRQVVDRTILPDLSDHLGPRYEEMAREHVRTLAAAGDPDLDRVDRWWNRDSSVEIDIVGSRRRRVTFAGSVTWGKRAGPRELALLRRASEALPNRGDDVRFALVAREKVDPVGPGVLALTAADLLPRA